MGWCYARRKLDIFGKRGGRQENLIWVRGSPHYFDLRVRGTRTFFTENAEFSAKTPHKKSNMRNFRKSEEKTQNWPAYYGIFDKNKFDLPPMVFLIKFLLKMASLV